jgi:hypothetical protein
MIVPKTSIIKHHAMKKYGRKAAWFYAFLISELEVGECWLPIPGDLYLRTLDMTLGVP